MSERERSDSISSVGSVGSVGDGGKKRGRAGEGEIEAFRKSRKVVRSPKMEREDLGGWRAIMKEMIKGGMEELKAEWAKKLEESNKQMREQEIRWKEEKEGLLDTVKGLEKRVIELETGMIKEGGQKCPEEARKKKGEVEERMKEVEIKLERKEREERRRNIVIRGVEVKEGKREEAVEEILECIGAKAKIEEVKRLGRGREGERKTIWVRFQNEEQKRVVMIKKSGLKGRKERIVDDWTWKERKMRWKLEEIARTEMGKGKRVWIGYGRIKIEEKWWRWMEKEEVLVDEKGVIRGGGQGEKRKG